MFFFLFKKKKKKNLGNTALHYALNFNHNEIADLLLYYGANELIRNKNGKTPWESCYYNLQ